MSQQDYQARQDLTDCYHLIDYFGWTDLIYTHISVRLPEEPTHFLINEFGLLYHEIAPENLVKVNEKGDVLSPLGAEINQAGYIVHSAIHQARPDVNCIIHTHSPVGMALSTLECGLLPSTQHACRFYNKIAYHDYEGVSFDEDEQPRLIKDLADKNVMILRNHGFLTTGRTVKEAFISLYFLEKAAQAQLTAHATGQPLILPSAAVCEKTANQFLNEGEGIQNLLWNSLKRLLVFKILMTLTQ